MRPAGVAPGQMARRQMEQDPHANVEGTGQLQAMLVALRDVERLLPMMPVPVQQSMPYRSQGCTPTLMVFSLLHIFSQVYTPIPMILTYDMHDSKTGHCANRSGCG